MFKKSHATQKKTWGKNVLRSVTYSSMNVMKSFVPSIAGTAESFVDTSRELSHDAKDIFRSVKSTVRNLDNSESGREIKRLLVGAKEDLRTGNLSLTKEEDNINYDEYDNYDDGYTQESYNDDEDESAYNPDYDNYVSSVNNMGSNMNAALEESAKSNIRAIHEMTDTLANIQMKTTQASSAAINQAIVYQTNVLFNAQSRTNALLTNIDQNLIGIAEFLNNNVGVVNSAMMQHMENSERMLTEMKDMMAVGRNKMGFQNKEQKSYDFITDRGIDFKAYTRHMKKNIMNSSAGMLINTLEMAKDVILGSDQKLTQLVLEQALLPALIPGKYKKSLTKLNDTVQGNLQTFLENIGGKYSMKNFGIKGGIINAIASIMGIKPERSQGMNLANYTRDEIGWNGIAQKSLVEVIPSYLSTIEIGVHKLAQLSSKDLNKARRFDYRTGQFKTMSQIHLDYLERNRSNIRYAAGDLTNALEKTMTENEIGESGIDIIMADINALLIKEIMRGNTNSDQLSNQLSSILKSVTTPDQYNRLHTELNKTIRKAVASYNQMHRGIEENPDGTDIFTTLNENYKRERATKFSFDNLKVMKREYAIGNIESAIIKMGYDMEDEYVVDPQIVNLYRNWLDAKSNADREYYKSSLKDAIDEHNAKKERQRNDNSTFGKLGKWFRKRANSNERTRIDDVRDLVENLTSLYASKTLEYVEDRFDRRNLYTDDEWKELNEYQAGLKKAQYIRSNSVSDKKKKAGYAGTSKPVTEFTVDDNGRSKAVKPFMGGISMTSDTSNTVNIVIPHKLDTIIDILRDSSPNNKKGKVKKQKQSQNISQLLSILAKTRSGNLSEEERETLSKALSSAYKDMTDPVKITGKSEIFTNEQLIEMIAESIQKQTIISAAATRLNEQYTDDEILAEAKANKKKLDKEARDARNKYLFDEEEGVLKEATKAFRDTKKHLGYYVDGKAYKDSQGNEYGDLKEDESILGNLKRYGRNAYKYFGQYVTKEENFKDTNFYKYGYKFLDPDRERRFGKIAKDSNSAEELQKRTIIDAAKEGAENIVNSAKNAAESIFGANAGEIDKKKREKASQKEGEKLTNSLSGKWKKVVPKAGAAAVVGAGIGALAGTANLGLLGKLFFDGGPIAGAIIGGGLTILNSFEGFHNFVFGKENEKGEKVGGLISDKLQKGFKALLPAIVGGAVIGGIKGLFGSGNFIGGPLGYTGGGILLNQLLPGGILGGALLGVGAGILHQSGFFHELLFGSSEEDGKKEKKSVIKSISEGLTKAFDGQLVKRGLKGAGIGVVTGATLSSMGIAGGALSLGGPIGMGIMGLGLGIASNSEKFQRWMFGEMQFDKKTGAPITDANGKPIRKGGFITDIHDILKVNIIQPVGDKIVNTFDITKHHIIKAIAMPFHKAVDPIVASFKVITQDIKTSIENAVDAMAGGIKHFTEKYFKDAFRKSMYAVGRLGTGAVDLVGKGVRSTVSAAAIPLHLLGGLTRGLRKDRQSEFKENIINFGLGNLQKDWDQKHTRLFGRLLDYSKLRGKGWREIAEENEDKLSGNMRRIYDSFNLGKKKKIDELIKAKEKGRNIDALDKDIAKYVNKHKITSYTEMTDDVREGLDKIIKKHHGGVYYDTSKLKSDQDYRDFIFNRNSRRGSMIKTYNEDDELELKRAKINRLSTEEGAREHTIEYQNETKSILSKILGHVETISGNSDIQAADATDTELNTSKNGRAFKITRRGLVSFNVRQKKEKSAERIAEVEQKRKEQEERYTTRKNKEADETKAARMGASSRHDKKEEYTERIFMDAGDQRAKGDEGYDKFDGATSKIAKLLGFGAIATFAWPLIKQYLGPVLKTVTQFITDTAIPTVTDAAGKVINWAGKSAIDLATKAYEAFIDPSTQKTFANEDEAKQSGLNYFFDEETGEYSALGINQYFGVKGIDRVDNGIKGALGHLGKNAIVSGITGGTKGLARYLGGVGRLIGGAADVPLGIAKHIPIVGGLFKNISLKKAGTFAGELAGNVVGGTVKAVSHPFQTIGNLGSNITTVANSIKALFKKIKKSISDSVIIKLFKGHGFANTTAGDVGKMWDAMEEVVIKNVENATEEQAGEIATKMAAAAAEGTAKTAAAIINVVTGTYDAVTGAFEADKLFNIDSSEVTLGMRAVSGLMKFLLGLSYFPILDCALELISSFIGYDIKCAMASAVYKFVCNLAGLDDAIEALETHQDEMNIEAYIYNEQNDTNLSTAAYSDLKNPSALKKFANWITGKSNQFESYDQQQKLLTKAGFTASENGLVAPDGTTYTSASKAIKDVASGKYNAHMSTEQVREIQNYSDTDLSQVTSRGMSPSYGIGPSVTPAKSSGSLGYGRGPIGYGPRELIDDQHIDQIEMEAAQIAGKSIAQNTPSAVSPYTEALRDYYETGKLPVIAGGDEVGVDRNAYIDLYDVQNLDTEGLAKSAINSYIAIDEAQKVVSDAVTSATVFQNSLNEHSLGELAGDAITDKIDQYKNKEDVKHLEGLLGRIRDAYEYYTTTEDNDRIVKALNKVIGIIDEDKGIDYTTLKWQLKKLGLWSSLFKENSAFVNSLDPFKRIYKAGSTALYNVTKNANSWWNSKKQSNRLLNTIYSTKDGIKNFYNTYLKVDTLSPKALINKASSYVTSTVKSIPQRIYAKYMRSGSKVNVAELLGVTDGSQQMIKVNTDWTKFLPGKERTGLNKYIGAGAVTEKMSSLMKKFFNVLRNTVDKFANDTSVSGNASWFKKIRQSLCASVKKVLDLFTDTCTKDDATATRVLQSIQEQIGKFDSNFVGDTSKATDLISGFPDLNKKYMEALQKMQQQEAIKNAAGSSFFQKLGSSYQMNALQQEIDGYAKTAKSQFNQLNKLRDTATQQSIANKLATQNSNLREYNQAMYNKKNAALIDKAQDLENAAHGRSSSIFSKIKAGWTKFTDKVANSKLGGPFEKIKKFFGTGIKVFTNFMKILTAWDNIFNACTIFNVEETEVSFGMLVTAWIWNIFSQSPIGSLINTVANVIVLLFKVDLENIIVKTVYKGICKLFGMNDELDRLTRAEDEMEMETLIYNHLNNTNNTVNTYSQSKYTTMLEVGSNLFKKKEKGGGILNTVKFLWNRSSAGNSNDTPEQITASNYAHNLYEIGFRPQNFKEKKIVYDPKGINYQMLVNQPLEYVPSDKEYTADELNRTDPVKLLKISLENSKPINDKTMQAAKTSSEIEKLSTNIDDTDIAYGTGAAIGYGPNQADPRWANFKLGRFANGKTSTMATGGCGPTALAQVAGVNPLSVAKMAKSSGYISQGGANANLMTAGARKLGLQAKNAKRSYMEDLKRGKPVVISGRGSRGNSPFTKAGHIVTATGVTNRGGVVVSDPMTGTSKVYSKKTIDSGMTGAWSYNKRKRTLGYGPGVSWDPTQSSIDWENDVHTDNASYKLTDVKDRTMGVTYDASKMSITTSDEDARANQKKETAEQLKALRKVDANAKNWTKIREGDKGYVRISPNGKVFYLYYGGTMYQPLRYIYDGLDNGTIYRFDKSYANPEKGYGTLEDPTKMYKDIDKCTGYTGEGSNNFNGRKVTFTSNGTACTITDENGNNYASYRKEADGKWYQMKADGTSWYGTNPLPPGACAGNDTQFRSHLTGLVGKFNWLGNTIQDASEIQDFINTGNTSNVSGGITVGGDGKYNRTLLEQYTNLYKSKYRSENGIWWYPQTGGDWANLPYNGGLIGTTGSDVVSIATALSNIMDKAITPNYMVQNVLPRISTSKFQWSSLFNDTSGIQYLPELNEKYKLNGNTIDPTEASGMTTRKIAKTYGSKGINNPFKWFKTSNYYRGNSPILDTPAMYLMQGKRYQDSPFSISDVLTKAKVMEDAASGKFNKKVYNYDDSDDLSAQLKVNGYGNSEYIASLPAMDEVTNQTGEGHLVLLQPGAKDETTGLPKAAILAPSANNRYNGYFASNLAFLSKGVGADGNINPVTGPVYGFQSKSGTYPFGEDSYTSANTEVMAAVDSVAAGEGAEASNKEKKKLNIFEILMDKLGKVLQVAYNKVTSVFSNEPYERIIDDNGEYLKYVDQNGEERYKYNNELVSAYSSEDDGTTTTSSDSNNLQLNADGANTEPVTIGDMKISAGIKNIADNASDLKTKLAAYTAAVNMQHEGKYYSINGDDRGSYSVGIKQWKLGRSRDLMNAMASHIESSDPNGASILRKYADKSQGTLSSSEVSELEQTLKAHPELEAFQYEYAVNDTYKTEFKTPWDMYEKGELKNPGSTIAPAAIANTGDYITGARTSSNGPYYSWRDKWKSSSYNKHYDSKNSQEIDDVDASLKSSDSAWSHFSDKDAYYQYISSGTKMAKALGYGPGGEEDYDYAYTDGPENYTRSQLGFGPSSDMNTNGKVTAADVINKALGEQGVMENPPDSNNVKYNQEFYGTDKKRYPWCVVFPWWVFKHTGASQLFYDGGQIASCTAYMNWSKSKNRWHSASEDPLPGDIAIMGFGGSEPQHMGMVIGVLSNGKIQTIEGNTSGNGSQDNGGMVMVKERPRSDFIGFDRPPYSAKGTINKSLIGKNCSTSYVTSNNSSYSVIDDNNSSSTTDSSSSKSDNIFTRFSNAMNSVSGIMNTKIMDSLAMDATDNVQVAYGPGPSVGSDKSDIAKKLNIAINTTGVENKLDILIDVMKSAFADENKATTAMTAKGYGSGSTSNTIVNNTTNNVTNHNGKTTTSSSTKDYTIKQTRNIHNRIAKK